MPQADTSGTAACELSETNDEDAERASGDD